MTNMSEQQLLKELTSGTLKPVERNTRPLAHTVKITEEQKYFLKSLTKDQVQQLNDKILKLLDFWMQKTQT